MTTDRQLEDILVMYRIEFSNAKTDEDGDAALERALSKLRKLAK